MFKPFAILALFFTLCGCGGVRQFLFPSFGMSASDSADAAVVTPAFLLEGRAARHQDSLRERLAYLKSTPAPKGLSLRKLEFRNTPDSVVQLVATYDDDRRINSHGLSPAQIQETEMSRILKIRPLWISARQTKLDHPLVVRAVFKSRDYLFQNRPLVQDTAEVLLPDSVAKAQK
jgi:hypothetical protein